MPVLTTRSHPDIHVAAIPFMVANLFLHISVTQYAHADHKQNKSRNDPARMLIKNL